MRGRKGLTISRLGLTNAMNAIMVKLTADVAADQANAIIATNGFCSARRFVQRLAFFIIALVLQKEDSSG